MAVGASSRRTSTSLRMVAAAQRAARMTTLGTGAHTPCFEEGWGAADAPTPNGEGGEDAACRMEWKVMVPGYENCIS